MLQSNAAEFLAIYGRRRVGKTFLIVSFFEKEDVIFFNVTGVNDGSIYASGISKTIYSEELVDGVVTLEDLFDKV